MNQQQNFTVDQRAQQLLSNQISNYAQQNALLSAENEALWQRVRFLEQELQKYLPSEQTAPVTEAVVQEQFAVETATEEAGEPVEEVVDEVKAKKVSKRAKKK